MCLYPPHPPDTIKRQEGHLQTLVAGAGDSPAMISCLLSIEWLRENVNNVRNFLRTAE